MALKMASYWVAYLVVYLVGLTELRMGNMKVETKVGRSVAKMVAKTAVKMVVWTERSLVG
jgi:hypothetical protein